MVGTGFLAVLFNDHRKKHQHYVVVTGFLAVLWFLLWCILVTESPAAHPGITNAELEYIQQSIGYTEEQSKVGLHTLLHFAFLFSFVFDGFCSFLFHTFLKIWN